MQAISEDELLDEGYTPLNDDYLINRYINLGSGTFGNVYKGYDLRHQRFVAIKHIPRRNFEGSRESQTREIKVMQKLNHPNIMKFYGYEGGANSPDGIFMFLELCEGGTLRDRINCQMTEREAMDLFGQLVEGMAYINEQSTPPPTQPSSTETSSRTTCC